MLSPWSTCLLCLLSALVSGYKTSHDQHVHDLRVHYEHLAYIADFECDLPQPRVIPSHRLFSKKERHGKAFFPDVTVLHRCDDAVGCCPQGDEHCGVLHQESVHLPFKITFLEDFQGHKKGSWIIEYFYFYNHTECGCAVPEKIPAVPEKIPAVPEKIPAVPEKKTAIPEKIPTVPDNIAAVPEKIPAVPEKKPNANLESNPSSTEVPFDFQPLPTSITLDQLIETSSDEKPSTDQPELNRIRAAIGWKSAPFFEQPSQKL